MRLLLIDNYDSFTYNLYQYLCELGAEVVVRRNDAITADEAAAMDVDGIVISPGPGTPANAGICDEVIERVGPQRPVLGVCLGMQCIAETYGGRIVRAPELRHGKTSLVSHTGQGVLAGLPNPFQAVRYHSLMAERDSLPACLEVTAQAPDGTIMALRHREYPVEGVQFHPESILTEGGKELLQNFLRRLEPAAASKGAA
ncbi:MAG: aminodeoxychorismate/anthranilate synthase component II [Chloroflexi bacterium]|nr:aminodeoxychorismate/anthranilate synthase component II [Chloroflexota bacterium]